MFAALTLLSNIETGAIKIIIGLREVGLTECHGLVYFGLNFLVLADMTLAVRLAELNL